MPASKQATISNNSQVRDLWSITTAWRHGLNSHQKEASLMAGLGQADTSCLSHRISAPGAITPSQRRPPVKSHILTANAVQIGSGLPGQGKLTRASIAITKSGHLRHKKPFLAPGISAGQLSLDSDRGTVSADERSSRRRFAQQRRGGAAAGGRRQSMKHQDNPFIEYEDREKRLQQERKWLQEDSSYLEQRTADLRKGKVQNKLDCRSMSPETLFDNRMFYTDYAVKIQERKVKADTTGQRQS